MPILRMIIVFGSLWLLLIVVGAVSAPFLPTNTLLKLHTLTDSWLLRPLNSFSAWIIEARQFRSRDE